MYTLVLLSIWAFQDPKPAILEPTPVVATYSRFEIWAPGGLEAHSWRPGGP